MTSEAIEKLGYEYDPCMRSYFHKSQPEHKYAFPPFGFTRKMLVEGLELYGDGSFKFGEGGIPRDLVYL